MHNLLQALTGNRNALKIYPEALELGLVPEKVLLIIVPSGNTIEIATDILLRGLPLQSYPVARSAALFGHRQ